MLYVCVFLCVFESGRPWECVARTARVPGVRSCPSDQGSSKAAGAAVSRNSQRRTGSSDAVLTKGDR